jgi:dihydrofolate reductase
VTIVLTRDPSWSADGVLVAPSLAAALELADGLEGDVAIAGGTLVYAEAMPVADEQVLTYVHLTPGGDTFYPDLDPDDWVEQRREPHPDRDVVWLARA